MPRLKNMRRRSGSSYPKSLLFISSALGTLVVMSPSSFSIVHLLANGLGDEVHNPLCAKADHATDDSVSNVLFSVWISCKKRNPRDCNTDHRKQRKNHSRQLCF